MYPLAGPNHSLGGVIPSAFAIRSLAASETVPPEKRARVMPDASTWYKSYTRNTNGLPTSVVEEWVSGGTALYRTNTYSYGANGIDLVQHIGPLGESVQSNWFNANHEVVTNYDALGQMTVCTYDGTTLQLLTTALPSGLNITNTYDANHRLQTTVDSLLRTNSYTWNSDGMVATFTDERHTTVTEFWDGLHRLTGMAYPDGTTTTNLYTVPSGTYVNSTGGTSILAVTATQDRLTNWTHYVYDSLRRPIARTNANNVATTFGYCECGALTSLTNGANTSLAETTSFVYDNQSRRIQIYHPDGSSVTNTFDLLGRLVTVSDSMGSLTKTYDNLGRLTAVSNAFGQVAALAYDSGDNVTSQTDANAVTVTTAFDVLHRPITKSYPDGGVEGLSYSAKGLLTYTNQLGFKTWYTLDAASRKTAETNANSEITRYAYDLSGNLTNLLDPKSNKTLWHYDLYGRATNKVDAAGTVVQRYQYDADDRLTNRWMVATGNTGYSYDPVGSLTNIAYSGSSVRFKYDALNRRTNMVDSVGTTVWTWLAGGLMGTETGPFSNDKVTYAYINRLRASLTLTQPTGSWVQNYTYDSSHRLLTNSSPSGVFVYSYNAAGTVPANLAFPNISGIANTYDTSGRLTGTSLTNNLGTVVNSHGYSYNTASQRTQQTRTDGSTVTYTYDPAGQLKTAHGSGGQSTENPGYLYDAAGNLGTLTNGGNPTFTVNSDNELTAAGAVTCSSDGNGNLTFGPGGSANGAVFQYDAENRLTSVSTNGNYRSDFAYDGVGRLKTRSDYTWLSGSWYPSSPVNYVHDGNLVIQERSGTTPVVSYTRGTDFSGNLQGAGGIGGMLARDSGYSGGSGAWSTHFYYHTDGNGNITYLESTNQLLAASYRYDPFGNTFATSGTMAAANTYRFSSKEINVNFGIYYYGYRFYNPVIQRWLNRDPILERGGINMYGFVQNEPTDLVDPFGESDFNAPPQSMSWPPAQVDPGGQYGFFDGLFDEFTDSDGYTACYAKCMLGGTTAHAGAELGGATYAAKKWYSWKNPKLFKAGGKYSKKLVPKLAGKLSACLAPLAIKEASDCYKECKDRQ